MNAAGQGISVVVPACGRVEPLARCMAALAAQQPVAGGVEVVISIDGEDPTPSAVLARVPAGLSVRVVDSARTGPAGARNRGAAAATGDVLAFCDDDCEPEPGWAAALAEALERHPGAVAGGPIVNARPRDASAAASHAVLDALYSCSPCTFLASANMALRRERFVALGGFDEGFPTAAAEDRELCARAVDLGMEVVVVLGAVVRHHRPSRPVLLWRQYAEYGRGARRLDRSRTSAGRPPVRAGRGFPRALAGSTARAAREARAPSVVALVALTQVATVWGYATCRS
jgi:GT2 family glycosyltransferase